MVLLYVLLNASGALIIKNYLNHAGTVSFDSISAALKSLWKIFTAPQVIGAFAALFGAAIAWIIALSRMDLSVAYPVAVGLNFGVVVGISLFFYGEPVTLQKLIGLSLVFMSIVVLAKA